MKRVIIASIVCFMLLFCITANAETVNVMVAPFYTEVNHQSVDNSSVRYPIIVYKDVTYLPMTYDLCWSLGLMSEYTDKDGLYITYQPTDSVNEDSRPYGNAAVNTCGARYTATLPSYPITLNGIRIHNETEQYPLLNFRGVTYLPMTYRFAYEQLGLEFSWSDTERSFRLTAATGNKPMIYPRQTAPECVEFLEIEDVYKYEYNELLEIVAAELSHTSEKCYIFDTKNKQLRSNPRTDYDSPDTELFNVATPTKADEMKTEIKDNAVHADGLLLIQLTAEDNPTFAYARKNDIGNNTLIVMLSVGLGDVPAPYTQMESYVFEVKNNIVRRLDIDVLYGVYGIFDMGDKVYISAHSYRPVGSSRWSNMFSDVFVYDKLNGSLESLLEKNTDKFNSIRCLGFADGKLYVKAMRYDSNKQRPSVGNMPTFSAADGGFYSVDVNAGDKMTKLYPYISGETFVFADGELYCVANYGVRPVLVNLCTGETYKFD